MLMLSLFVVKVVNKLACSGKKLIVGNCLNSHRHQFSPIIIGILNIKMALQHL